MLGRWTMLRRTMIVSLFVAALVAFAPAARAGSDAAAVGITATVDTFAEWSDASPTIAASDWSGGASGHLAAVSTTLTYTKALTLYANVTTTLAATGTTNSGILTNGSYTLTTSYQIQGDVTVPDSAYMAAGSGGGEFFEGSNTYTVTHTPGDGSYAINLLAKAVGQTTKADEAGNYTCTVTLTGSW